MKKIFKYKLVWVFIASIFVLSSCNEFLDVNKHPNKQTDPTLSTLTTSAIIQTAGLHASFSLGTNRYTQHICSVGDSQTDRYYENRMSGTWYSLYTGALADLNELKKLAEQEEAYHFLGVAEILIAANIGAATDVWDAVPFSEALKGNENYTPKYDSQNEIYEQIYTLLDDAIANLQKTDVKFDFSTIAGDFDLIYGGDKDKWLKLAYAFKARYLLHQGKSASEIISAVDNSLSSIGDDANFVYTEQNHSPYYSIVLSNITGNLSVTFGDYFVKVLSGDVYGTAMDPRLPIIADTTVGGPYNGEFHGHFPGAGSSNDPQELVFTENCWHFGPFSPLQIMTYSEVQFIKAEAEFNSGNLAEAYSAWENGVRANMEKLGVAGADIDDYITNSGVTATNITIADIMKEKYIALFLQYEAWNDMRRYNYGDGTSIYGDFPTPIDPDPALNGQRAKRVLYPLTEETRNAENCEAAKGSNYNMAKPVTWNQ